jgi:hypothetical protein
VCAGAATQLAVFFFPPPPPTFALSLSIHVFTTASNNLKTSK